MSLKIKPSYIKFYLLAYNYLEAIGWAILLFKLLTYYIYPTENLSLYENVKWTLIIFQNIAVLEILHAFTGIVSSNPVVTTQQVFSRVFLVCGVLMSTTAGRESLGLPLLLFAWSTTEIIRYTFYGLNLTKSVPYFILWLRYTTFIVLYPIGVTGELLCLYSAQNEVSTTKLWTLTLPNFINFYFNYRYSLILIMLSYVPFFPQLYLHMCNQRRKIIGNFKFEGIQEKVN